jgi:hypothetical protein
MSKEVPVTPVVIGGTVPVPEQTSTSNAFTEVTIKQLYFFLWKWAVAAFLFALPFIVLSLLLRGL